MLTPTSIITMLGFGDNALVFAALLQPRGNAMRAWDPTLAQDSGDALRGQITAAGVDAITDLATALRGAKLVVVDTVAMSADMVARIQNGQRVLRLGGPVEAVISVLVALGVPEETAARSWPPAPGSIPAPRIGRGELP